MRKCSKKWTQGNNLQTRTGGDKEMGSARHKVEKYRDEKMKELTDTVVVLMHNMQWYFCTTRRPDKMEVKDCFRWYRGKTRLC